MSTPAPNAYDRIAYRTLPMPQTHPDRLATIALLHGMTPRPIDRCRVLELGCGDGSNMIPMAYGLPGSEFVGVDLAATAVAAGTDAIAALRVSRVTARPGRAPPPNPRRPARSPRAGGGRRAQARGGGCPPPPGLPPPMPTPRPPASRFFSTVPPPPPAVTACNFSRRRM